MAPEWTTGDRLRKAREWAGISTSRMAEELGVERSTISRWEHGRGGVRRQTLLAYALRCSVPIEWLEAGEELVGAGEDLRSRCFTAA